MAATVHDSPTFIDVDLRFHAAILSATHNHLLTQLGSTIEAALRASRAITVEAPGSADVALPLHMAVAEAIVSGDAPASTSCMERLIQATAEDMATVLRMRASGPGAGREAQGRPQEA